MAKHVKHEKYVDKKVNLACLLIGLVLVIATIFVYSTTTGSLDFAGVATDISAEEITDILESLEDDAQQLGKLFMLIIVVYISVLQIIAIVNVIRLIIGWFGFIGSKDSNKMAKKLVKHAKIAFGTMGIGVSVHVLAACDNGVFASGAAGAFVVTGLCVILSYLAVRYYKWFVVEKLALTDWLFTLIREVIYFVFPIFLFGFVGNKFFGTLTSTLSLLATGMSGAVVERGVKTLLLCFTEFFVVLAILGIVKKTIKFLPFDSYKKPAHKMINRKYRTAIIMPLILVISSAVVATFTKYQTFVAEFFVSNLTDNLGIVIRLIIAAVAVSVMCIGADDDEDSKIKLAVNKAPEEPAAESVESDEATPIEE